MLILKSPKSTSTLEQSVDWLLHFSSVLAVSLRAELRKKKRSGKSAGNLNVLVILEIKL